MMSPMIKATLQAACLSSISNILAQIVQAYRTNSAFQFNLPELVRFILLTLITAPPNYKWQQLLEAVFPAYEHSSSTSLPLTQRDVKKKDVATETELDLGAETPARRLNIKNTLAKWFIDCITVGTLLNTVAFYVIMGLLKGQSSVQIERAVKMETIPLILTGYRIWPLVSIISFSFVPVEKRIVFGSFIGLLWGIYMSILASGV